MTRHVEIMYIKHGADARVVLHPPPVLLRRVVREGSDPAHRSGDPKRLDYRSVAIEGGADARIILHPAPVLLRISLPGG